MSTANAHTLAGPDVAQPSAPKPGAPIRWLLRGIIAVAGLVVIYLLALGPAFRMNKQGTLSPEALERFMAPMLILDAIPGVSAFVERYVQLWVGPEPTELK